MSPDPAPSPDRRVLTPHEVTAWLGRQGPGGWEADGGALFRRTRHGDFAGSLRYVDRVGALAEAADHHPDIEISWDTVTLHLVTHSSGGITRLDLALAAQIDELDRS